MRRIREVSLAFKTTLLVIPFIVKVQVLGLGRKAQMKLREIPLLLLQGILLRKIREVSSCPPYAKLSFYISQGAGLGARTKSSIEIKRNPMTVTNVAPQARGPSETCFISSLIVLARLYIKV